MSCDMRFDYEEALKRQHTDESDVFELREKIRKYSHVPTKLSNKKLLCFLHACNGVDDAAKVISTYYEVRQSCPAVFSNRDPLSNEVQQCLENQYYFHMPNTPSGYSVIYHCLSNNKASNYKFDEACKTFFMTLDSLLCTQGPSNGLIIVFDMKNVGYRHLLRTTIDTLRTFFHYLQDALPARLEAMHIMNCGPVFNLVLAMIKPFMRSEIIQKMHLHPCGIDYKKFHKEHIPSSCLPSDFEGQLDSIIELHKNHCEMLARLREYFIADEKEANLCNA
ncbi:unnamed protein product [Chironomus riparius]|uniref:CRAL-TRIO domain-containing protein n=1 Tax=Chironomus riparius TaxID=315576 RepID=A0A9N9RXW3_9DIPT|nr:unnamed protein product [Chironomus riparius]